MFIIKLFNKFYTNYAYKLFIKFDFIIKYFLPLHAIFGTMAERLGSGLQNRVQQFESAWYLKTINLPNYIELIIKTFNGLVVNCFQNLYLCHRKQYEKSRYYPFRRCELLSKFVSLSSETIF